MSATSTATARSTSTTRARPPVSVCPAVEKRSRAFMRRARAALARRCSPAGCGVDGWEDYSSKLIQTGTAPLNQHPADQSGVVPTGRLGVRQELTNDLYARAAVYAGFRPATLNELHRPFRVGNDVTEANSSLTPEKALRRGDRRRRGAVRQLGMADLFYNQLATTPSPTSPSARGQAHSRWRASCRRAARCSSGRTPGPSTRSASKARRTARSAARLELRAAFTYTHARVDGGSAAPQLTGLKPAETPTATVTAVATWTPVDRLTLVGDVRYESARFDDDQNTRRIDAGTGVNARAEWGSDPGAERLRRRRQHLFDSNIETGRSAADIVTYDAPRIIRLGLTLRR